MSKFETIKSKFLHLLKSRDDRIKELETENERLKAEPKTALNLSVEELKVPAAMKIDGPVEIANFPEQVREVEIKNFPQVQEVVVKNQKDFPKQIEIANLKELQKVEVTNPQNPDHFPSWIPDVLASFLKSLISGIDKITNKVFTVKMTQGMGDRPIRVTIIDRNGKQIDLKELGANSPIYMPAGSFGGNTGGTGGGTEGGALETTLQDVLTQLEAINTNTDSLEVKAENINLNTDGLETKIGDTLDQYKPSDIDESDANTKYYGFVNKDGNWYIMKVTATAIRYVSGSSGYETPTTGAWATRASKTYDYFHNVF